MVTGTKPDGSEGKAWEEKDLIAQEVIVSRIDESVMIHLLSCSTSAGMWEKLVTIYEPKSKVSVHLTLQRFYNLPFEEPVIVFISRLDELTHNIKSMAWESVQQPTLTELQSRLMIEEERSKSEYEEKSIAFIGARRQPSERLRKAGAQRWIGAGGRPGHQSASTSFMKKNDFKCHFCGKHGHYIKECRKEFDINVLQVFGTEVYVHIPKERRLKWDAKSRKGVFVGFGQNTKGFRVWFHNTNIVDTFRDVVFTKPSDKEVISVSEERNDILKYDENFMEGKGKNDNMERENTQDSFQEEKENTQKRENDDIGRENQPTNNEIEEEEYETGKESNEDSDKEKENMKEDTKKKTESQIVKTNKKDMTEGDQGKRKIRKPRWFEDYDTSFTVLNENQLAFIDAIKGEESDEWKRAIEEELEALRRNHT
ncbi:unnamed protein product [Arctia plantaginis]|uniref:CCHC-type domain-containing protein n=1 Tax=Arctia plantaginis TaxID=874455 RepID=A0A8S0ZHR4_ARCPL|nr:unnamed protein product [Arctia plantaginis]